MYLYISIIQKSGLNKNVVTVSRSWYTKKHADRLSEITIRTKLPDDGVRKTASATESLTQRMETPWSPNFSKILSKSVVRVLGGKS